MNRRGFFAALSALVAVPAFVKARVKDANDAYEYEQFIRSGALAPIEVQEPWTALFIDERGRFVHHSVEMDHIVRWAVVPVLWWDADGEPHQHVYDRTRFELIEADETMRVATYRYTDGPRPALTGTFA